MQFFKPLFLVVILFNFNSLAQKSKPIPPATVEQFPTPADSDIRLFYIQRSSNINTILYDANLGADKKLDPENPVHT